MGFQKLSYRATLRGSAKALLTDTVFILASGPSVNELTSTQFVEMSNHTSIGISHWAVHPFAPDFLSIEQVEDSRYVPVAKLLSKKIEEIIDRNSKTQILYLRPRNELERHLHISIPEDLKSKTYVYGRVTLTTKIATNLKTDIDSLLNSRGFLSLPENIVLDAGSSVLRMVTLAILAGFRNIVLIGVDLNSNEYFFETPDSEEKFGISSDYEPWINRTEVHPIESLNGSGFPFSEIITEVDKAGQISGRWRIWLGTTNSALAGKISPYEWSK